MSGSCASVPAATQTSFGQTTGQTGESSQDLLESLTLSAVKAYENVDWNTCKVPAAQDLINSRTANTPSSFYQDYISKRGEDAGNDIPELDCVERLHQIEAKDNGDDLFNCETIYYLKNNEGAKFKLCPYCPIKWYNKLPFFDTVSNAYTHHMNGVHGILNSGNVAKQPAFGVVINTSTKKHSVCAVCPYDKKDGQPGSCSALIQLNVNNNVGTGSALKAYYRHVTKCHKLSSKTSNFGSGINHNEEIFIGIEQLYPDSELDLQEQEVEPTTPPANWIPEVHQAPEEFKDDDFSLDEIMTDAPEDVEDQEDINIIEPFTGLDQLLPGLDLSYDGVMNLIEYLEQNEEASSPIEPVVNPAAVLLPTADEVVYNSFNEELPEDDEVNRWLSYVDQRELDFNIDFDDIMGIPGTSSNMSN